MSLAWDRLVFSPLLSVFICVLSSWRVLRSFDLEHLACVPVGDTPLTSLACHVSFHGVLQIILQFLLFSFYSGEIFAYDPLIISRLHTGPLLTRRFLQLSVCEGGNAYAYGDESLGLGKAFSCYGTVYVAWQGFFGLYFLLAMFL